MYKLIDSHSIILTQPSKGKKSLPPQTFKQIQHVAQADFTPALLEVDKALWGGFWQGDVIAPGYQLPAQELALLRAIRLDETWPEQTTLSQYVADLRQAMLSSFATIWTGNIAGLECVVFVTPSSKQEGESTVVWYCQLTNYLHAGYRTRSKILLSSSSQPHLSVKNKQQASTQLDRAIQQIRSHQYK
ncbi:hypothetical protein QUF63_03825 [Anaerolineales bacterium HSG25]|nr:hypothetical protein [Anaerolineales bacterium HSG25]